MKKLSPQKQQIIDFLEDGEWHCFATPSFFIKDDRKRISELNEAGYNIIGMKCDGRCGTSHSSGVFMRKLDGKPVVKKQVVTQMFDAKGKPAGVSVTYA